MEHDDLIEEMLLDLDEIRQLIDRDPEEMPVSESAETDGHQIMDAPQHSDVSPETDDPFHGLEFSQEDEPLPEADESLEVDDIIREFNFTADAQLQEATDAQAEATGSTKKEEKTTPQKSIVLYLHDLSYLIAGIVLVFLLCFRIVIVSGDSMYDTLVDGDYLLLVSNVFYHEPQQGDIIVASKDSYDDGTPIIKRVIATEGQTVDIDFMTGTVYVDGVALDEDYIYTPTTMDEGVAFPLEVEEGCVFVLGDNRGRSKDSRNPEIGQIDTRQIVGKAIMLVFPGSDHGTQEPQFDRIGVID